MPDDLETLFHTFRNESMFVQMAAANALQAVGAPAVPGLLEALDDDKDMVRASAARLLAEIPFEDDALGAQAIDRLTAHLSDPNDVVRWYAAQAIGALARRWPSQAKKAVPPLIELLEDDTIPYPSAQRAVCEMAANALQKIGTPEAKQAVETWWGEQDDDWF